jgi:hypothetical protein
MIFGAFAFVLAFGGGFVIVLSVVLVAILWMVLRVLSLVY